MRIVDFRLTRFQFARDRIVGDSQVQVTEANVVAVELIDEVGRVGLGFSQSLHRPFPEHAELARLFREQSWSGLEGEAPGTLAHRVSRPRGGRVRRPSLTLEDAIQQAVWDLFAKQVGLPLWSLLGGQGRPVRAYASGLDFHLDDAAFQALFADAASQGFKAFKIKVGHAEPERDLHRLNLLREVVGADATVMVDANEAWSPKEALRNLETFRQAGHDILWLEDPVLRNDFDGLKLLRAGSGTTLINSGEYLDVAGKRQLMIAGAADMLNVHGAITDVMRIGWLAAELGVPVTLGNTFLEVGVNLAVALPEVEWLEYSFQNFEHLVERPYAISDGFIRPHETPGHGLVLSEAARQDWSRPDLVDKDQLGAAPEQARMTRAPRHPRLLEA